MGFITELSVNYDRKSIEDFFREPETWFRLNPEWEVRSFKKTSDSALVAFTLEVTYDRSEQRIFYNGSVEMLDDGIALTLDGENARRIHVMFAGGAPRVHTIRLEEISPHELEPRNQTELVFWLKSTCDYLSISTRTGVLWRVLRFLLDKIWLRLSPTGRRVVLLVIAFEVLGLVLLIGFLIINRWFTS